MIEIQAPIESEETDQLTVFLAGSIEMGVAEHWQDRIVRDRDDWDSSWKQTIDDPQFNEQVTWELEHLERADLIVMYFDPSTKSPITLLELGLFAQEAAMIVCCPDGFWRKGNVDIVCKHYGVAQVDSIEVLIERIKCMAQ